MSCAVLSHVVELFITVAPPSATNWGGCIYCPRNKYGVCIVCAFDLPPPIDLLSTPLWFWRRRTCWKRWRRTSCQKTGPTSCPTFSSIGTPVSAHDTAHIAQCYLWCAVLGTDLRRFGVYIAWPEIVLGDVSPNAYILTEWLVSLRYSDTTHVPLEPVIQEYDLNLSSPLQRYHHIYFYMSTLLTWW